MLSKLVGLLRTFRGVVKVGSDKNGNSYYRKPERVDGGGLAEKRWVEFKVSPDPTRIPVEWTSWLSGTRKEAPTETEIMDLEAQRKNVKLQASLLQKEEEKARFRARVLRKEDEGRPEDLELMMRQIDSGESHLSRAGSGEAIAKEPSYARYTRVRDVKESEDPTTWQPPREGTGASKDTSGASKAPTDPSTTGSSEPQGQGDEFVPGTWRP